MKPTAVRVHTAATGLVQGIDQVSKAAPKVALKGANVVRKSIASVAGHAKSHRQRPSKEVLFIQSRPKLIRSHQNENI